MGIGIPASVESVLFTSGRLLTQMFVAGMGTSVIAGNFIAFSIAALINLPEVRSALLLRSLQAEGWGRTDSASRDSAAACVLAVHSWINGHRPANGPLPGLWHRFTPGSTG